MKHIMRWLGRIGNNYKDLQPKPAQFITSTGAVTPVSPFPVDFKGIRFYCMEDMSGGKSVGYVVMIDDFKLISPLLLHYEKHTDGKRIGPRGCSFGDDSAKNLLTDIAIQNPDQKETISQIYEKYFDGGAKDVNPIGDEDRILPDSVYFPNYNDFDNARRIHLREGKTKISVDELLNTIEMIVKHSHKILPHDWREVTRTNISSWARKRRG